MVKLNLEEAKTVFEHENTNTKIEYKIEKLQNEIDKINSLRNEIINSKKGFVLSCLILVTDYQIFKTQ